MGEHTKIKNIKIDVRYTMQDLLVVVLYIHDRPRAEGERRRCKSRPHTMCVVIGSRLHNWPEMS